MQITLGQDILTQKNILASHFNGQQIFIVTQKKIADHHLEKLKNHFDSNFQVDIFFLPDGEQHKNIFNWQKIIDELIAKKHDRTTTLIALGGGVVGDITGFAAACYQRGVNYIQVPTTLIAQVDSAIGGKTAVNHPSAKNMIGAFYHPQSIIVDVSLLLTLPEREYVSGFAEMIKYGLIADKKFFNFLEKNVEKLLARDLETLEYVISHCIKIKTSIVKKDEKDKNIRKILNFGHTFGHAIEKFYSYQILHGEAVAMGIKYAAELSCELEMISSKDVEKITSLLNQFQLLRNRIPAIEHLLPLMQHDKKIENRTINFVLLEKIGKAIFPFALRSDTECRVSKGKSKKQTAIID